jgi:hypothetical protein
MHFLKTKHKSTIMICAGEREQTVQLGSAQYGVAELQRWAALCR